MAIWVVQTASQLVPAIPRIPKNYPVQRCSIVVYPWTKNLRFSEEVFLPNRISKVAEQTTVLVGGDEELEEDKRTVSEIKDALLQALEGSNRGIFGVKSEKKTEINGLVEQLESQNPTPNPTLNLHKVDGCWKLLYTTITILGKKRTKLGLRDFISLGDLFQNIDASKGKAVNVIKFSVRGLNLLNGQLTIEASFNISSNSKVEIKYDNSTITPHQLMNMFEKNYDLLLGIFNPQGWLHITYVDDKMRIGRDDKGNIFILERSETKFMNS